MKKFYLLVEFLSIFIALPTALAYYNLFHAFMFILWGAGAGLYIVLKNDVSFNTKLLWNRDAIKWKHLKLVGFRFLFLGIILILFTVTLYPELLFRLPQQKPLIWLAVMVLYPILSVYPQEIIFRSYQMHRYKSFLGSGYGSLMITSITFSYAHIIFENWIALAFTLVGGIIFGDTYKKSNSLLLASIEHSLYGCLIFTIGLGKFFFKGHIGLN